MWTFSRNHAANEKPSQHWIEMLELRPNCECCDRDLPFDSPDALICTFECTFCRECAEGVLDSVCPNCGGNFEKRPIRPVGHLAKHPPSPKRVLKEGGCIAS